VKGDRTEAKLRERESQLTKYSDVLPDASLTPPLNTIEVVVCVWGVWERVAGVAVPLRMVVPRSQLLLPALFLFDMGHPRPSSS
jgi:hypothetical protein